jgi:hypothetical protein
MHTLPSIGLDQSQFDHDDGVSVCVIITGDVFDDKDEVDFDTEEESDTEDHAVPAVASPTREWIMVCEDPSASENSVTVCTFRSVWLPPRSHCPLQVLYDGHDEHCLYVSFQPGLDVRYVMRGFGDIENADGRITSEDMEAVNTVAYPGNKLEFRKTFSAEMPETQVVITVHILLRSPRARLIIALVQAENCGSGLFVVNISCHPRLHFACEGQGYFSVAALSS